jgi:hypothetical protein
MTEAATKSLFCGKARPTYYLFAVNGRVGQLVYDGSRQERRVGMNAKKDRRSFQVYAKSRNWKKSWASTRRCSASLKNA